MSVLIKGMKMPTRCDDCAMGHELNVGTSVTGYGCLAMLRMGDARIRPISCGTRPDWCPLVEVPHLEIAKMATNEQNQSTDNIAREARNQYYREYRAKNRDKIRAINKRYWEHRAAREQEAET